MLSFLRNHAAVPSLTPVPLKSVATVQSSITPNGPARITLAPVEHPDFPSSKGNTTFLVGGVLFTVNRYALVRHSPVFSDMFSLGPKTTTEGTIDNPIILPQLEAIHFLRFLKVLYPRYFDRLPFESAEEWYSVLLVADRLEFRECGIRSLAIKQLEMATSIIQKIKSGEQFQIKSLLIQGYGGACNRNYPLRAHELAALRIHSSTLELIMGIRETKLHALPRCERCPWTPARGSDVELDLCIRISAIQILKPGTPLFVIGRTEEQLRPAKPLPARIRLSQAYRGLIDRSANLRAEELTQLTPEVIEFICSKREQRIRASRCDRCARDGVGPTVTEDEVKTYFAKLLKYAE